MTQHILLYTMAPCLGALLASPLYQAAKKILNPTIYQDNIAKKNL